CVLFGSLELKEKGRECCWGNIDYGIDWRETAGIWPADRKHFQKHPGGTRPS
ncbi:hypothetical protein scyTo_0021567, partial [Scyliorhinus torazame]|nr:hypothetical protein [Scyliorhinus torazame]